MNLQAILEGLLYISGDEGLTLKQIKNTLKIDENIIKELINELTKEYNKESRGLKIEKWGDKIKLTTKPQYAQYYKEFFTNDQNNNLSSSALETLAIIAYNQPITRIEIDEIRGVSSIHHIKKLLFLNLIQEKGRSNNPGRPILYGVTNDFLDYFGLSSLEQLPEINIEEKNEERNLYTSNYKE